jgi:hypothetical protein
MTTPYLIDELDTTSHSRVPDELAFCHLNTDGDITPRADHLCHAVNSVARPIPVTSPAGCHLLISGWRSIGVFALGRACPCILAGLWPSGRVSQSAVGYFQRSNVVTEVPISSSGGQHHLAKGRKSIHAKKIIVSVNLDSSVSSSLGIGQSLECGTNAGRPMMERLGMLR